MRKEYRDSAYLRNVITSIQGCTILDHKKGCRSIIKPRNVKVLVPLNVVFWPLATSFMYIGINVLDQNIVVPVIWCIVLLFFAFCSVPVFLAIWTENGQEDTIHHESYTIRLDKRACTKALLTLGREKLCVEETEDPYVFLVSIP